MPRLLSSAITARKGNMKRKTKLTMCKGEDNDEYCSSGESADVLIFPDMIRYRQLRCSDVDSFVEDVLVREAQWSSGSAEGMMESSHIFICAHGNRDRRCGVCGPVLVSKFQEVMSPKFQGQVCVKPCSHVGGHKYAGNVIVFNRDVNGEVSGHWYGYVAPEDAPLLVEEHIGKGNIVDRLWRGQMGLSPEDQRKAQNLRLTTF
ncbi:altered inheritance of mitochondria protein 32-like, partial [Asparagus officinalis]|uniref:altered inheritance of mitochondria protein 32-like n=1 Tax=Asparagus officinalis TaxID=4686 RepID=UPI00098E2F85